MTHHQNELNNIKRINTAQVRTGTLEARIVAQTEFLVIVPRQLGSALAQQENVKVLEPPMRLPSYKVKQHWHERYNQDAGDIWLRKTMASLFGSDFSTVIYPVVVVFIA